MDNYYENYCELICSTNKSYLQLIRLKKKEKTIHSKTLFTISVDLKST